jgi:hypothetical protein
MSQLSEIWGASDKPERPNGRVVQETLNDKAWTRFYVDELINKGLNDTFDGWVGKNIMDALDCTKYELVDMMSVQYDAFTLSRAKELAIRLQEYREPK